MRCARNTSSPSEASQNEAASRMYASLTVLGRSCSRVNWPSRLALRISSLTRFKAIPMAVE